MAQSVERPTPAQVTISRLMGSSPASGSGLTAQSPEPVSDSVSPSLSAPPLLTPSLSLKINALETHTHTHTPQNKPSTPGGEAVLVPHGCLLYKNCLEVSCESVAWAVL